MSILGRFLLAILVTVLSSMYMGLHTVPDGYVGTYTRGGALLRRIAKPGWNTMIPWITRVSLVQVSLQTDRVVNIPCGTAGGVTLEFESIEVVNRLHADHVYDTIKQYGVDYDKIWIFDKIHHEMNQFCSRHSLQQVYIELFDTLDERLTDALQKDCDLHAPGIEIIATRVTKPRIPASVASNYERMEAEKTRYLATSEEQKVIEKQEETKRLVAMIMASQEQEVSAIRMNTEVLKKQADQTMAGIERDLSLAMSKAQADAEFYRKEKLAAANEIRLNERFLEDHMFQRLSSQDKVFYGTTLDDALSAGLEKTRARLNEAVKETRRTASERKQERSGKA